MIHNGRRWLVTLLLALVMVMMTSAALAITGTVSVDSLVLREEMSTKSEALQTLGRGQEIEVIHQDGSWYKVRYGKYTGYVMSRYVKVSGEVPSAEEEKTLRLNDRGSEVKAMQKRLKELGYLTGSADGVFGEKTEEAVKAFQKRNGLTADGVAGPATLKALESSSAKAAESSSTSASDDTTLREGSKGTEVKKLQTRLKELGYYTGSIDGVYGSGTIKAIRAFQERNKLTVDGVAGPSTQKVLYSSSAKAAEDEKEPEQNESTEEYTELRSGSRGDKVKKLQTRLKALGYYSGSIDGVYGSGTIKAIRAFQERNKLTVDGVAGANTQKVLYSSSAKKAADDAEDEKEEDTTDDGTLREGSRGQAVKTLQEKLKKLGYYSGSIDGVYGSGTIKAVRAFQERNKLTVDGVAGTDTLKVLYSSSAKEAEDEDEDKVVTEELRAGAYGEEVRTLQKRLKELGYYKGSIDGSYGTQTVAAVKAFQTRNGLTVDGVAGGKTLTCLNSSSAKKAEDDTADDDQKDDEKDDGVLRPGDSGDEVKELQYRLKELGYYSASRDGVYGSATRTAVMAFQTRNGLTVDGIAGPATLKKLNSSSAVAAGSSSSSGSSSSGSSGSTGTTDTTLKTNQTLKPGDTSDQVSAMQKRLKELGYYTGTVDGEYGYGTRQAVIAFQRNNGLTQDGIAGESTLKKMVSSSAVSAGAASSSKYITERLDWFNGGSSRIPRGAIFQVKDVRTGYVFTAKRQGGSYHLDAEPLTAADTAIMRKIYGGEFNYRRRPMLVLYNGRVYACSIYGEEHGDDTIASNDFDGQFCLHFYGSKTHGTDRVDEDHQKCEAQALQATR